MPGSPVLSGYYGVRRSFLSDSDFHGSKPLPGDAHSPSAVKPFACRDSWEQTLLPDAFSQPDPVPTEALQTLPPSASCLSPLESVSSTQHRSASWGASLSGTQPYSLHTLEDLHHAPGYPTPPPYPFAPFMTMSNDLLPKGLSLSPDEGTDASSLHDPSPWTKDDGSMAWGSYECRRAY
uniref:Chromosome 11 open reading frame 53 n=1 Tax=Cavia porcellus TaxID=10141 RepID=H0VX09_CAVPO